MSFTPGIPKSGQSLGNSRPQVQGNFDYINTAFAINHIAFNSSGVGKHKFLQMPEQSPNGPATLVDEGALYTRPSAGTQLFWRPENTLATGTQIQMTNIPPVNSASGYTFLPGGMLLQWKTSTLTSGLTPVTFPTNFDAATFPYSIQLTFAESTPAATTLSVSASSVTNLGFSIRCSPTPSGSPTIYWIAIGKRLT